LIGSLSAYGPPVVLSEGADVARAKKKQKTKRGSPQAIAKRKAARKLNDLFSRGVGADAVLDGRTLKRKKRLLDELAKGKGGRSLNALEVLSHADQLLALGETLTSLRKIVKAPPPPARTEENQSLLAEAQQLYGFNPRAWKLLGVDIDKFTARR